MSRRPPLIVGLVIVTLLALLFGVFELGVSLTRPQALVQPSVFKSGYYTPKDRIVAGGMYLPGGPAQVGYSLDVRFESSDIAQRVTCGFFAPHGEIGLFQANSVSFAGTSGRTAHLSHTALYSAPTVQLEVVCFPQNPGVISISMNNLKLTSKPVSLRECRAVC